MTDPFESLASPPLAESPRPEFVRRLRSQLVAALGITVEAPERNQPVTEAVAPTPPAPTPFVATVATPYLCARDAASALRSRPRSQGRPRRPAAQRLRASRRTFPLHSAEKSRSNRSPSRRFPHP